MQGYGKLGQVSTG